MENNRKAHVPEIQLISLFERFVRELPGASSRKWTVNRADPTEVEELTANVKLVLNDIPMDAQTNIAVGKRLQERLAGDQEEYIKSIGGDFDDLRSWKSWEPGPTIMDCEVTMTFMYGIHIEVKLGFGPYVFNHYYDDGWHWHRDGRVTNPIETDEERDFANETLWGILMAYDPELLRQMEPDEPDGPINYKEY